MVKVGHAGIANSEAGLSAFIECPTYSIRSTDRDCRPISFDRQQQRNIENRHGALRELPYMHLQVVCKSVARAYGGSQ
jgi:hypothetical protein